VCIIPIIARTRSNLPAGRTITWIVETMFSPRVKKAAVLATMAVSLSPIATNNVRVVFVCVRRDALLFPSSQRCC
jgi:hypothetical protein